MENHICILIWIILISGSVGGFLNFLLVYKPSNKWSFLLLKSVSLGIGASFLVPLFLRTISSSLINYKSGYELTNYLIIGGFCLLASIFSKRFIEDLYSRVVKAEKEAKEALTKTEEIVESKSEIDDLDEIIINKVKNRSDIDRFFTDSEIKSVIDAIQFSNFTFRSVNGISKETKITSNIVSNILKYLKQEGYTSNRVNNNNMEVWRLK